MLFNQIFSALALASLGATAAVSGPKVLSLPMSRRTGPGNTTLSRRSTAVNTPLGNEYVYYSIELELGNPGQKVKLDVDTGSSDLWVDTTVYNARKSSNYKSTDNKFSIYYGDGSNASGPMVQDDITLGGTTLKDGNFAVATKKDMKSAVNFVIGVGYQTGESSDKAYSNFPMQLKEQGFTESVSYSLWLNDWNDKEGSLLFGGVDHALYEGQLGRVPVVSHVESDGKGGGYRPSQLTRLSVVLNSIGISANGQTADIVSGAHVPVLLDTGTTFGVFPSDWVKAIADTLGATYSKAAGGYITTNFPSGNLELNFSGVTIQAPLDSFLRPYLDNYNRPVKSTTGKQFYQLSIDGTENQGVSITDGSLYILGDAFLAGAYVAFDLEHNVVGFANAKLGVTSDGSQVEAIGSAGIPGTDAPGYATATYSDTSYTLHTPTGFAG